MSATPHVHYSADPLSCSSGDREEGGIGGKAERGRVKGEAEPRGEG